MVVCLENAKGINCTPAKDVSAETRAASHPNTQRE